MTPEQEENARKFFAVLAAHGVTNAIALKPAPGGDHNIKIESDGELTALDKRDRKRKKIKIQ